MTRRALLSTLAAVVGLQAVPKLAPVTSGAQFPIELNLPFTSIEFQYTMREFERRYVGPALQAFRDDLERQANEWDRRVYEAGRACDVFKTRQHRLSDQRASRGGTALSDILHPTSEIRATQERP